MRTSNVFLVGMTALMLLAAASPAALPGTVEAFGRRPGWVERYEAEGSPEWDGWRNALKPEGDASRPLAFARKGETEYAIILPEEATVAEERAAGELQLWLGKMTGAEFPVLRDAFPEHPREFSVGMTNRVGAEELEKLESAGEYGYAIALSGERVYLLGGGRAGPLNAALALLEEDLGVRWYEPSIKISHHAYDAGLRDRIMREYDEKPWPHGVYRICKSPTMKAEIVPRVVKPGIPLRDYKWKLTYTMITPWGLRNRMNFGRHFPLRAETPIDGYGQVIDFPGHTFHRLVPPEKYFNQHPEYFSLIDGERTWRRGQLCLSNPDVAVVAAKSILAELSGFYEEDAAENAWYSVSPMDWAGDCECADCREIEEKTGAYSGLLIKFLNRVAGIVEKEYPGVTIYSYIYRQSKQPPEADVHPAGNVAIHFCTDFGATFNWPYHSFYDEKISEQKEFYDRWRELSGRMKPWIYAHQYSNCLAPMPNIRPVAENIRFFSERGAESMFIGQSIGTDAGRDVMRLWVFSKLMWDPSLDIEELILDFIWGYYGPAAREVAEYNKLLWDYCAAYTDFAKERNWRYPIHEEAMYGGGFIKKAREILGRAEGKAADPEISRRVRRLKAGVVYVESVLLYAEMRKGNVPPDVEKYVSVLTEFSKLCDELDIELVTFLGFGHVLRSVDEWVEEMEKMRKIRVGEGYLPPEAWGEWTFRKDPENRGLEEEWYRGEAFEPGEWDEVHVPAFLKDTKVGPYLGYGWYRVEFIIPEGLVTDEGAELHFGAVDEQAWIFVNGAYAGEHTLESEFIPGEDISVGDLWNSSFTIKIEPGQLRAGKNVLVVRKHSSRGQSGIHAPVGLYIPGETPDS